MAETEKNWRWKPIMRAHHLPYHAADFTDSALRLHSSNSYGRFAVPAFTPVL